MEFWAIASGGVGLLGLIVVSAIQPHLIGKAAPEPLAHAARNRLDLAVLAAVAFILLAIAAPNLQHYLDRPFTAEQLARLAEASRVPAAQEHLKKANAELLHASQVAEQGELTPADRSRYWASIQLASSELLAAKNEDPSLADSTQYTGVARQLQGLEERARRPINLTAVSPRPVAGLRANPDVWILATIVVAGLFLLSVIGLVILVAVLHRGAKPETAKRWLRTYLEPISAACAILIGTLIALNPALDHGTALWGAGVAGSGLGFWIKK